MIRATLDRICAGYLQAKSEIFKGHALGDYIRNEAPKNIESSLAVDGLMVRASAGQTGWGDIPWISIFDPVVTTTMQEGYYVCYLFSAHMKTVNLCLGQGTTFIQEEFGRRDAFKELVRRGELICSRLPEIGDRFTLGKIDLEGKTARSKAYGQSVAFSNRYDANNLPDEAILNQDLNAIAELYLTLTQRGGIDNMEDFGEAENSSDMTFAERKQYAYHRRIERNAKISKAVKKIQGFTCQVCGFNFEENYGQIGKDYIEAHHLYPLHTLPEGKSVPVDPKNDFSVLCSNCHRMVHRKKDIISPEELRSLIEDRKNH